VDQFDVRWESLVDMIEELSKDVDRAYAMMSATREQPDRRTFVRAVLVAIEAATFLMKHQCLARDERDPGLYTFEELSVLREETYSIDHRGQVSTQPKFLPTNANFRFALNLFMRPGDKDFQLDAGGKGWDAFKKALQIRHRLTHPKSFESLQIDDEEVETVIDAYAWFCRVLADAMYNSVAYHAALSGEPKEKVEAIKARVEGRVRKAPGGP
jgi:hypothetical protein